VTSYQDALVSFVFLITS